MNHLPPATVGVSDGSLPCGGPKKSLAMRQKLSKTVSGKGNPMYGRTHSKEARKKISLASKGRIVSDETRIKISTNMKRIASTPEWWLRDYSRNPIKRKSPKKKSISEIQRIKLVEASLGGFWYGNIRYPITPQYCEKWTADLRERVRAFWGYCCAECGNPQNGIKLAVHHVHYNKKTCCDGSPRDLVPLCIPCHNKTHSNRGYWEDHFTEMIYGNDPNGKCYFTIEEMNAFARISLVQTQNLVYAPDQGDRSFANILVEHPILINHEVGKNIGFAGVKS